MQEFNPEDIAMGASDTNPSLDNKAYNFIQYEENDCIATITLNRAPTNYLNMEMLEELSDVVGRLTFNPNLRILVLRSACEYFCSGFSPEALNEENLFISIDRFHKIIKTLLSFNLLTVSVVKGPAYGAGSALAILADFSIASESAKFGHPEIKYGHYTPIAALLYARILPKARATYLLLSGDAIDAKTAAGWGLVTWILPDAKVDSQAARLVDRLSRFSGPSLEFGRKSILYSTFGTWETDIQLSSNWKITISSNWHRPRMRKKVSRRGWKDEHRNGNTINLLGC